jgi:hypothetical protein
VSLSRASAIIVSIHCWASASLKCASLSINSLPEKMAAIYGNPARGGE